MTDFVPRAELLRSLGRLVRGLSTLFWGLPIAMIVCVRTVSADLIRVPRIAENYPSLGLLYMIGPCMVATGLLLYALAQMREFQPQERVWRHALDRTQLLAVANIGLCPFLFFWNRSPGTMFYQVGFGLMILCALLFLFNLNQALHRLAAMLPDETLRTETALFTRMNLWLLCGLVAIMAIYATLAQLASLPGPLIAIARLLQTLRFELIVVFGLLPFAMTMTLVWKAKEVVFASVFGDDWPRH